EGDLLAQVGAQDVGVVQVGRTEAPGTELEGALALDADDGEAVGDVVHGEPAQAHFVATFDESDFTTLAHDGGAARVGGQLEAGRLLGNDDGGALGRVLTPVAHGL